MPRLRWRRWRWTEEDDLSYSLTGELIPLIGAKMGKVD